MIRRVAHICIACTDLEHAERFYTDMLGLRRKFGFRRGDREIGFYLEVGGDTFIEVFLADQVTAADTNVIRHFCLEVQDMEAMIQRLRSHGVAVSDKTLGQDQSRQCWIEAPDGVRIELHEYTNASHQFTGADCCL